MTQGFTVRLGEVLIRPAAAGDIEGMARVNIDTWKLAYDGILPKAYLDRMRLTSQETQRRRLMASPGAHHWVAEEPVTGEVVGFASAGPVRSGGLGVPSEIYELYVQNGFQGLGLGRRLFQAASQALSHDGFKAMIIWVLADNPARAFYERLGGQRHGVQMIRVGGALVEEIGYAWKDMGVGG